MSQDNSNFSSGIGIRVQSRIIVLILSPRNDTVCRQCLRTDCLYRTLIVSTILDTVRYNSCINLRHNTVRYNLTCFDWFWSTLQIFLSSN